MKYIYHITRKSDWEDAKNKGVYRHCTLDSGEGFIHCSTADQILSVAHYLFRGMKDLVILIIELDKVKAEVKFENLEGGFRKFPHIYGTINLDSVIEIADFPAGPGGIFKLPVKILDISKTEGEEKKSVIRLAEFSIATIYASDFEKSLDFYTRVLGMVKSRSMDGGEGVGTGGVLLDAANGLLTIYLEGGRARAEVPDRRAPRTCLCFRPEGGVRAAYEALRREGVEMFGEYMKISENFHMFVCADPDGMAIEFAGQP